MMRIQLQPWMIGLALMVSAVSSQAQALDPGNKTQMRQLAVEYCSKTADAKVCNCFADTLVKNFNVKDWGIFIADTGKSSAPPSGVGESDIDSYGKKLANAGNVCGLQ